MVWFLIITFSILVLIVIALVARKFGRCSYCKSIVSMKNVDCSPSGNALGIVLTVGNYYCKNCKKNGKIYRELNSEVQQKHKDL